ncbi:hypothetical protein [Metabacillus malikii]|uniref:Uncharacterized protein n=1 Tax=Metabacillus malikii TaxID=1504265 RepID=A0ABT9ZB65_9BACI|nr:hypothetical protein [Metabacillus malikii]MDQ0229501.1 hypothetical protein [Metabacillus malikii]
MKVKIINFFILIFFLIPQQPLTASTSVKVLDIESNELIKTIESSKNTDQEVECGIHSITGITIQANPLPNNGYLIKIPLMESLKVKNQWMNDIVSEVIVVYNPSTKQNRIIIYNDENSPVFFDTDYTFSKLMKELNL